MEALQLKVIGDSIWCVWKDAQVTIEFSLLREHSDGLSAEANLCHLVSNDLTYWARVNLASSVSRASLAKGATEAINGLPWRYYIDTACLAVAKQHRTGTPAVPLTPLRPDPAARWLIDGLVLRNMTNIVYGDGGSCKSLLGLTIALAGLTGRPVVNQDRWHVAPVQKVLFLDWESTEQDWRERLWGLCNWQGSHPPPESIFYRAMTRSLAEEISAIKREVAVHGIDLLIVDSLGASCGHEPESADAAIRTMNAIRSLGGVTTVIIGHVSKASADHTGPSRPYGSVYVWNLARSNVEARASEEGGTDRVTVTYYQRKTNYKRMGPTALTFAFDDEHGLIGVLPGEADLSRAGTPRQIIDALRQGSKDPYELAEELGQPVKTIQWQLGRLKTSGVVQKIGDSRGGRGRKTQWGLVDKNFRRENESN